MVAPPVPCSSSWVCGVAGRASSLAEVAPHWSLPGPGGLSLRPVPTASLPGPTPSSLCAARHRPPVTCGPQPHAAAPTPACGLRGTATCSCDVKQDLTFRPPSNAEPTLAGRGDLSHSDVWQMLDRQRQGGEGEVRLPGAPGARPSGCKAPARTQAVPGSVGGPGAPQGATRGMVAVSGRQTLCYSE